MAVDKCSNCGMSKSGGKCSQCDNRHNMPMAGGPKK